MIVQTWRENRPWDSEVLRHEYALFHKRSGNFFCPRVTAVVEKCTVHSRCIVWVYCVNANSVSVCLRFSWWNVIVPHISSWGSHLAFVWRTDGLHSTGSSRHHKNWLRILLYISKCHLMEQTTFRGLKDATSKTGLTDLEVTQPALLSPAVIDSTCPVFIYVGFYICGDIFWCVHNDA